MTDLRLLQLLTLSATVVRDGPAFTSCATAFHSGGLRVTVRGDASLGSRPGTLQACPRCGVADKKAAGVPVTSRQSMANTTGGVSGNAHRRIGPMLGMLHRDRMSGSHREMRQISLTLLFPYTVHAPLAADDKALLLLPLE